jgi:FkbM family methyltransferase
MMSKDGAPATDTAPWALLLAELPLSRLVRIADVGANPVNVPAYADLLAAGGCEVIGFEPQPDAFAALESSRGAHEIYHPVAVGDGTRKELKIVVGGGLTSLLEPDAVSMTALGKAKWTQVLDRVPLDTVRLDDVADLGAVDLLKIDIQGGEVDVFRGAKAALSGAVAVICELRFYPLYVDEPMLGGVDNELRAQGFHLHKLISTSKALLPTSQRDRLRTQRIADQLVDGDGVYIRALPLLKTADDQTLMRLALLASSVFGSHGLALHLLDQLAARKAIPADLAARYVDRLPNDLVKKTD